MNHLLKPLSGRRPLAVTAAVLLALLCTTAAQAQLQPSRNPPPLKPAVPTLPDLVVSEIRPVGGLRWGNCGDIQVTVRNQGKGAVPAIQPFTVRLWIDYHRSLETSSHLDLVVSGGLASGASTTITFHRVHTGTSQLTSGIGADVDATKQVDESDETNNRLTLGYPLVGRDCQRQPITPNVR